MGLLTSKMEKKQTNKKKTIPISCSYCHWLCIQSNFTAFYPKYIQCWVICLIAGILLMIQYLAQCLFYVLGW